MEWQSAEVTAFIIEILNLQEERRNLEIQQIVEKHHVTGVDLVEMNE
jgi:hypothetical protein